ncbi:hypothetical protein SAMN05660284_00890 [Formivibrio citricus]|uniref:Restriction endonuclease n=1 Tax=Formivibrio citricus TaxID=83765 RepID=A0A1I4X8Z2_9NEIS|nr:hypothetical protein [Formivibrio citricus]SFN22023.1 hypothetical protein SAMN05660284_00890 [Formivibrio citricus]
MLIPVETYEAIFEQYSAAMKWMAGLGIKLSPGRTSHYEKIIGYWTDVYKTATADEGRQIFPDFVSSMFEISDFVSIFKAFGDVPVHQITSIIEKLQKAVNGPINAADETSESTTARNFLFEAAVAAKAHRPGRGIEAILDAKSDTGISLSGKKIWVECKRVTTIAKIESNTRKASSQLEAILEGAIGSGHRGIVALDVSKILNRGDTIFVTRNDDELLASVDSMMDRFIEEHSHIWQRVYQRRHKKIIGTIISFSFMASSEARNLLVHASQWAMNPRLEIATSDAQIQRQLVALLSAK